VEITGKKGRLPKLRFYQRDFFLNVVGELAYEPELVRAVEHVIREFGITVEGFTFIPWYPDFSEAGASAADRAGKVKTAKPRYELLIELRSDVPDEDNFSAEAFAEALDRWLQRTINDYRQMRREFGRLDPPVVSVLRSGSWSDFNKNRMVHAGQPKYIHIAKEPEFRGNFDIIYSGSAGSTA